MKKKLFFSFSELFFQEEQKGSFLHARKQFTLLVKRMKGFLSLLLCFAILMEECLMPFGGVKCWSPMF